MSFIERLKSLLKGRDLGAEVDAKIAEKVTVADKRDVAALFKEGKQ